MAVFAGIKRAMRSSYPFREHLICLLPAVAMLCGIHLWLGTENDIYHYFTAARRAHPSFTEAVELFSDGVLFFFYPVYAFFFVRGLRERKKDDILFTLCYVLAQVVIAALLCRIVKIAVGRPRPMTGGPFEPFSFGWGYQSFPSGHAGEVTGSCLPLLWRYAGFSRYLLPLALGLVVAAVCFSRLYLSMHHATDIWGGLVFGSLSGYVSWALFGYLRARWRGSLPKTLTARSRSAKKEHGS